MDLIMEAIDGYRITSLQQEMDFALIHHEIGESYWAKGIPASTMAKAMANSLCFAILTDIDQQVGFARVISDFATFAYLADVFVVEAHRGRGLSKWLVNTINNHPELQGLRRSLLATADAHGLYSKFGYKPLANPDRFMEQWDPYVYQSQKGG